MNVILLADVKGQGKKGDVVKVSDGYARNFLLPKKLAVEATKDSLNMLQGQKSSEEYRKQQELESAKALADKLKDITVELTAKAGENGKLFGSITSKDVAEELKMKHHIVVDKKKFNLPDGIKSLGTFNIDIKLHKDVVGVLKVNVTAAN